MNEKAIMLISLSITIISIVICVTAILRKWFDSAYRIPENSDKLNIIGFLMIGLIEPPLLFLLGMIYKVLA